MATSKKSKKSSARELDVACATKGVWLIKVPKYLSDAWGKAEAGSELGVMRIGSSPKNVEVSLTIAQKLAAEASKEMGLELPQQHKVLMNNASQQSLAVFSEDRETGLLQAEGRVAQKADVQPTNTTAYMKLKQHQIKQAEKTKYVATILSAPPVGGYKPVKHHVEYEEDAKAKQENKRVRQDKEVVLDLLFTAFHKHEFYNIRDLVQKTKQPPAYLKEILREVCQYNTKAPHKNMWQLKPEYKHYGAQT